LGNLKGRDHLKDLGVDEKMILKCIVGKWDGKLWAERFWLRIKTIGWLAGVDTVMNLRFP
jgi:hypothetical protein